ncbi:MAG: DUF255 domain-containing protein [Planctomycetales bacterium]|nr:DUF255 domain-containing protein [Planctomycetales bacterium]
MRFNTVFRAASVAVCGLMLLVAVARRGDAVDDGKAPAKPKAKANRLARETSPYLLMHAHNPVDWYAWGPEAFEKARKEGKLIFLSVGYSSCYWCHVMERKVFMNETIAKTMNDNFVCIKVDREERPDVDDIYMTALQVYYQAIGAQSGGGWPLSMFITADGKPVAGGTYFPPEDSDKSMGFPSILGRLNDLWKDKREQLEANADILANETRRVMRPKLSLKPIEVNDTLVAKSFEAVVNSFDPDFGGVDFQSKRPDGPKFPTPTKLLFVQEMLKHKPDADTAELLDLTLMQMACGGIRDHLGGGFHRYSVDRKWLVPHFEKMLYDQAQLADVYVNAFVATQKPLYKQVAEEILTFVEREMTSNEGGFYSALDAETNGIEGESYVWEAREIDNILGAAAADFKEAYHVKDLSDFEHGNVLRLSTGEVEALEGPRAERLAVSRQKLLTVRDQRQRPLRDEKTLTSWNGLMMGAFARAGALLNQPDFVRTAERGANFVLANLRDAEGRLLRTHTAGKAKLNAYLDDYAFVIDGLLALHDATDDARWFKAAKELQDDQLKMFRDETGGGFFFTSHHHEELLARTKNCYDGVLPAGNSVSARNLIKLAKLTGEQRYLDEARTIVELFASNLEQAPRSLTVLALAASELLAADKPKGQSDTPRDDRVQQVGTNDTTAKAGEKLILLAEQQEERPKKDELVRARAYLSTDRLPAGGTCRIVVLLDVKEGWHINANPPSPDFLKPTKLSFKSKSGVTLADPVYPKGHGFKMEGEDMDAMVYEGEVAIDGTLTVPKSSGGVTDEMEITVNYQACNEKGCQPPKSIKLTGKLAVAKPGESVKPINSKLFAPKTATNR